MKLGNIAISVVWIMFLASALYQGIAIGYKTRPVGTSPFPPVQAAFLIWTVFFIFSSAGVFFLRRQMYDRGLLRSVIDWKWGAGTYEESLPRLKPLMLMISC